MYVELLEVFVCFWKGDNSVWWRLNIWVEIIVFNYLKYDIYMVFVFKWLGIWK